MAKKKGKKKDPGKKKAKKKNNKKKNLKKKDSAKKGRKKEFKKKQSEKKKSGKKRNDNKRDKKKEVQRQDPLVSTAPPKIEKPKSSAAVTSAKSSDYNVRDALKKLKTLKSQEQVQAFTKGEKRVTITRAISPALRKFGS